jgi:hypothetical protein
VIGNPINLKANLTALELFFAIAFCAVAFVGLLVSIFVKEGDDDDFDDAPLPAI